MMPTLSVRRNRTLADPPNPAGGSPGQFYAEYDEAQNITKFWKWENGQWTPLPSQAGKFQQLGLFTVNGSSIFGSVGGVATPGGSTGIGGSATNAGGVLNKIGGAVTKDAPCPCRWEQVKTVKYLTDEPKPGSTPVMVQTSKWVCDQPSNVQTKVLCEETNAALGNKDAQSTESNPTATIQGLYGLGQALDPNIDYSGNVSVGNTKKVEESNIPWWAYVALGLAGGYAVSKAI